MKKSRLILIHICGWLLIILLPLLFSPVPELVSLSEQKGKLFTDMLISNLLLVIFFYFHYLYSIPRFYMRSAAWPFGFSIILSLTGIFLITFIVFQYTSLFHISSPSAEQFHTLKNDLLIDKGPNAAERFRFSVNNFPLMLVQTLLFRCVTLFFIALGIRIYERWQMVEKERKNLEISFLRTQINPHFLFNTLNSIYSLAVRKSDKTPDALIHLSSLMRYSVSEATQQKVLLEKEVKYVSDYLYLQQLRLSDKVRVEFKQQGNMQNKYIAPVLFISFIENAFKYGTSTDKPAVIQVSFNVEGKELDFILENEKISNRKGLEENTGIGTKNTLQRLELLYKGQYSLLIHNEENTYKIHLHLNLG